MSATIMTIWHWLEHGNFSNAVDHMKSKFFNVWVNALKVWPLGSFLIFYFVPFEF